MKDKIREMIWKYLPHRWFDVGMEDLVTEIHFRIEDLEEPEKHIKACIDYILEKGNGDPIGIDMLINEEDDGNIWEYCE